MPEVTTEVALEKGPQKAKTLIGERIPKLDAPDKAIGLARYIEDIKLPRMLYGKILFAGRPHARIVDIDTSAAKAMPGVRAVLTASDIELVPFGFGRDNTALKKDKVTCIRDEVAAVAADTTEIAAQAVKRIRVTYQDLPVVTSTEEALAPGAPIIYAEKPDNTPFQYDYVHGDVEQGIRESDVIVEDTYRLQRVAHCCLGTSGIIASFDAEGRLTLHSLTQVPFLYKNDLSRIVSVAPEKIRIIQPPIGGGFGSKLDIHPFEPVCVFLARATSRPVRLVFSRQEEFLATPTRQPMVIHLESGARRDGTFTFRDVRMTLDNGGHTSWGATTPWISMRTFSSLYRVPHVRQHVDVIYTNNVYACAFRGYGNPQATFALESQVDQLAAELSMDPLKLRLKNAQEPGETTGQGMVLGTCGLKECLQTAARNADWEEKLSAFSRQRSATSRQPSVVNCQSSIANRQSSVVRGIGMASLFHVGGGAKIYRSDGCGTVLKVDDFGGVTVMTGSSEIGQGSETVIAQIVAQELGLPIENIRVINNDTDLTPWDVGVHASRTTFIAGNSALRAARAARQKLLNAAAARLKRRPEDLDLRDGKVVDRSSAEPLESIGRIIRGLHFGGRNELIMTTDFYEPPSTAPDDRHMGNISPCYAFGTHVAEVEVDLDTGVVKVLRITAAHDVGRVINRLGIEGQVEGGIAQGMGYCLTEELKVEGGRILNPTFTDYKLCTTTELPELNISFVETHDPGGPYGAKGIGEAPLIPVAPAIANAIFNATGVRMTELPLTPEQVLTNLKKRNKATLRTATARERPTQVISTATVRERPTATPQAMLDEEAAPMNKLTVLSLEQALSLSYGTQRFVHLGWRVIRIEATPSGGRLPGDPNRYVGKEGERPDLHAYFIGPNVGKESIALNLKDKKGQEVLKRLIAELPVDVFASNTLPRRYKELGIDYETLSAVRPELIWVGLSAMGPDYPDAPGYDPAIQAITGYMDLTGDPDGPPMLCGVPFVDLKAGDEVFANVCLALAERATTGKGTRIDVSMAQAAASWLLTTIPLLDLGYTPDEVRRSGNEHREFVPVNVYPTSDGYIYLAIGNDVQWSRLTSIDAFSALASPARATNEGRKTERASIHAELGAVTRSFKTKELAELLGAKALVAAPIHTVPQVLEFPPIQDSLLETRTPSGQPVRLPPPSVEREHLASTGRRLPYAPAYGRNTDRVLRQAGFPEREVAGLKEAGVV